MGSGGHVQPIKALGRFLGELDLLVGFVSLGLATLLLRFESRRPGRSEGAGQVLALLGVMTAGAFALILARHRPEPVSQSPG